MLHPIVKWNDVMKISGLLLPFLLLFLLMSPLVASAQKGFPPTISPFSWKIESGNGKYVFVWRSFGDTDKYLENIRKYWAETGVSRRQIDSD